MNKELVFLLFLVNVFAIVQSLSDQIDKNNDVLNKTVLDSSGTRFQRILHRKKRFLLFPPGSAIVTTLSFTKTLVPRYPTGINMIGECDVFYPLQTKIADWYPTKKPKPPPPPVDEDEDEEKEPIPLQNVGPMIPQGPAHPLPLPPPPPAPVPVPVPVAVPAPVPIQPIPYAPQMPTNQQLQPIGADQSNGNRLPTDQEIGITPATIYSDPNFNVGSHPGEIYVNNNKEKSIKKKPPRRYDSFESNSYPNDVYLERSPWYQSYNEDYYRQKIPYSPSNNNRWIKNENSNSYYQSNTVDEMNLWQKNKPSSQPYTSNEYSRQRYKRKVKVNEPTKGHRERRDIFKQIESFMSSKQFNTKDCILRMICEAKNYLLPKGKSLYQDIFRALFTVPLDGENQDDYTQAMRASESDCDDIYSKRCRYSILGYLISKDRPIL